MLLISGCQAALQTPISQQPTLPPVTQQSNLLRELPPPPERIPVAVYDYPDLTGQFKERELVQSLSRAVTQGGASMLIKALQDAGERRWFTVLDRFELDDLLKERQIVVEMRRLYRNEQQINPSVLPPLRHAGIIMQGGIIGYDTNTLTGGLGARYLGIGGDTKWQQDTVTVTLRAVSTNTGEVLASVTVYKMIASIALQGGAFRYVTLDSILEAEAGVTQNEPRQVAVQQAIDKAVRSLVIEGAHIGSWRFADRARGHELIEAYLKEKYAASPSLAAEAPPPPDTANPTRVVETVPYSAPRRTARTRVPPEAQPPAGPPPAGRDEILGSRDGPPAATEDEVVGDNALPTAAGVPLVVASRK